jgi:plastocyanin
MKKPVVMAGLLAAGLLCALVGCNGQNPYMPNASLYATLTPTPLPAGTPTMTPLVTSTPVPPAQATVTYGGALNFVPANVTLAAGGMVTWDASFGSAHTVFIDDGTGNCVQNYTSFPVTLTFLTKGIFHYHCQFHSGCGLASCLNCAGMVGTVTVE